MDGMDDNDMIYEVAKYINSAVFD